MRPLFLWFAVSVIAAAQSKPGVILTSDFASDTGDWIAVGNDATVSITHDPAESRNASGALRFRYTLAKGQFASAALPTPDGLANAKRFRFWAKSDHDTAIGVSLGEQKPDGGDYGAWFWAPANVWQQVELRPSDFAASEGPTDPVDKDKNLDVDQIQSVAVFDLAYFFLSIPENSPFPLNVARHNGAHSISISGFEVLSSTGPEPRAAGKVISIDAFDRGFLSWITLGGMKLSLSPKDNPLAMPAFQTKYESSPDSFSVLTRSLAAFDLSSAKSLEFDIASQRAVALVLSLELKQPRQDSGPRYIQTIYPPAGRKVFHVSLNLNSFEHDENSVDGPANIDASRLKTLAITDISAATGGDAGPNTIWIGKLQALKETTP